jgi:thiamine-monophosphate kinase
LDEFSLIEKYFDRPVTRLDVSLGIGDDAALTIVPAGCELVSAVDVLVAGVHFHESADSHCVGHKALAVNLSDLSAMGATPAWATLGLVIPEVDSSWLEHFCAGFFALAKRYGVDLVGGDTVQGPLTVMVQLSGWVPRGTALQRSGAGPGDQIYITGHLGDAGLALMHVNGAIGLTRDHAAAVQQAFDYPRPRVEMGEGLRSLATAAIDVSDGFAADLGHLVTRSEVGAQVSLAQLPLSKAYQAHFDEIGWEAALSAGDDYELCFTAAPGHHAAVTSLAEQLDVAVSHVGTITADRKITFVDRDGHGYIPTSAGYAHFRS